MTTKTTKAPMASAVDLSTLRWTGPTTQCPQCHRVTRVLWVRPPAVVCCARCARRAVPERGRGQGQGQGQDQDRDREQEQEGG